MNYDIKTQDRRAQIRIGAAHHGGGLMRSLGNRVEMLERKVAASTKAPPRIVRLFGVSGNDPSIEVEDFLIQQGHDLNEWDIILMDAQGEDFPSEPYRDITPRREPCAA